MHQHSALTDTASRATNRREESSRRGSPLLIDMVGLALRVAEIIVLFSTSLLLVYAMSEAIPVVRYDDYLRATSLAAMSYAGVSALIGAYDPEVCFSIRRAWRRVFTAWAGTAIVMLCLSFLLKVSEDFSRLWAILWFASTAIALFLTRGAVVLSTRKFKKRGLFDQRLAIFGAGDHGQRLATYIKSDDRLTLRLVGFYDDRLPADTHQRTTVQVTGGLSELINDIRSGIVDQVMIALPSAAEARLQELVAELALTPVKIRLAPDVANFAFANRPVVLLGRLPVLTLFDRPLSHGDEAVKRAEDLFLSGIILILVAPILLLVAIGIKLDSRGPIFFRQSREGFNNSKFSIWKFRTMRIETSLEVGVRQATRRDPRVTRFGRFLRKTSLDELPQLFNVLQGDMSLVGPRPHAPSTTAGGRAFSEVVTGYAARHNVKPGITGWAQVCGWRGETDTEEKLLKRLDHDLHYMENWSVLFDLYILARTSLTLFFSRAAY